MIRIALAVLLSLGFTGAVLPAQQPAQTAVRTQTPVPRAPSPAASASDRAAIDRAIAAVYPSLVRISVVALQWSGGRELKGEASGSGVIISADGFVVTNHHVAGRVQRIVCTLPSNEEIPAELVGTDPLSDIAVIKLKPAQPRKFPVAKFGTSATLRQGDPVLAMGSPLALSQSVTRGIVSNTNMVMPQLFGSNFVLDGEDVGSIVKWIGHDAAIYPGNSGGPLVNLAGEIVGVNEISFGLGGAIPADLARMVAQAIQRDGRVKRGWTGIEVQPRVGTMAEPGGLVSWVADHSPAETAGVHTGDLLVRVNTTPIDVQFTEQLPVVNQALFSLPIGQAAQITVRREGQERVLKVTPVERPMAESVPTEVRNWGMVGADMSSSEAREMGRATADGVRVVNLRPGGPAEQARPPLGREDVIVDIEGRPVHSVAELRARTTELLGTKSKASLLVSFDRDLERRVTVVDVGISTTIDSGAEAAKPWVPVSVQVLTPAIAEHVGLKGRTGVRVTRVLDETSPLKVGDILLAVDGDAIRPSATSDEEAFAAMIRRYRIGSTVTLTVSRDGAESSLKVPLSVSPKLAREMPKYEDSDFEFRARDLVVADIDDARLQGIARGVIVESVSPGGWAALARLEVGDILLQVDGRPVNTVGELSTRMRELVGKRPDSVVFLVRRGIRTMYVELKPAWK